MSRSPVMTSKSLLRPRSAEATISTDTLNPPPPSVPANTDQSEDYLIEVVQLRNDIADTIGMQLHVRNESVNNFDADGEPVIKTYNRVFIASVAKDGAAAHAIGGSGSLRADDEILEVEGKVLRDLSPENLQATFREMPSVVTMKIKRKLVMTNKQDPLRRSIKPPEKPNRNSMIFDDNQLQLSDAFGTRSRVSSTTTEPNIVECPDETSEVTESTNLDNLQSHNDDAIVSPSSIILDEQTIIYNDNFIDATEQRQVSRTFDGYVQSEQSGTKSVLNEQINDDKVLIPGQETQIDDQPLQTQGKLNLAMLSNRIHTFSSLNNV